MAKVRLGRYEAEEYGLPDVCMKCGAAAALRKQKRFSWHPPWIFVFLIVGGLPGLIVLLILMSVLGRRMKVLVPLCDAHRYHWGSRLAIALGGLALLIALLVAGLVATDGNPPGAYLVALIVGFVAWLIAVIVAQSTAIRPLEITDRSITLTGVSGDFISALRDARSGYEDDEEDRDDGPPRSRRGDAEGDERPRRKHARADEGGYYDPGEERPRRPPPDAYEKGDER
jgi:hypothetical protein